MRRCRSGQSECFPTVSLPPGLASVVGGTGNPFDSGRAGVLIPPLHPFAHNIRHLLDRARLLMKQPEHVELIGGSDTPVSGSTAAITKCVGANGGRGSLMSFG